MGKDLDERFAQEEELRSDEEMLRKARTSKWIWGIVIVVIALGIAVAVALFGKSKIGDKVLAEMPEIEPSMAPPDWVEMEVRSVPVASEPAGAHVVVNGVLQEGVTPLSANFAKAGPNAVMLFLEGYEPMYNFVLADAALGQGLNVKLQATPPWEPVPVEEPAAGVAADVVAGAEGSVVPEPVVPVDPRYGKVLIKAENSADEGASVWFDGVLAGKLPVEIPQVRRGSYHHVLVKAEGKASYVAIFKMVQDVDLIALSLKDGVYLDRVTDIWVEPRPKEVMVHIGEKQVSGSLSDVVSKGRAELIQTHLEGYDSWSTVVHTTQAGQYFIRPSLTRPSEGRSLVHWRIAPEKYWYPCLKKIRQSVCWDSDKLREPREIESGTYELVAWEQVGNNVRDKRYAKNKPMITIEADKAYSFELNLEGDDVVLGGTQGVDYDSENPERAMKALKIPLKPKDAKAKR